MIAQPLLSELDDEIRAPSYGQLYIEINDSSNREWQFFFPYQMLTVFLSPFTPQVS